MKLQMMLDKTSPEVDYLEKLQGPPKDMPVNSKRLRECMVYLCKVLEVSTECPGAELILFVKSNRRYFAAMLDDDPALKALERIGQIDFPSHLDAPPFEGKSVQWVGCIGETLSNLAIGANTGKTSHFGG